MSVIALYTDASINEEVGKGAYAVFDCAQATVYVNTVDTSSSVRAENAGVLYALSRACEQCEHGEVDRVIVFTDSLSTVRRVHEGGKSDYVDITEIQDTIASIYMRFSATTSLSYTPGHVNNRPVYMSMVDALARKYARSFSDSAHMETMHSLCTELFLSCWREGVECYKVVFDGKVYTPNSKARKKRAAIESAVDIAALSFEDTAEYKSYKKRQLSHARAKKGDTRFHGKGRSFLVTDTTGAGSVAGADNADTVHTVGGEGFSVALGERVKFAWEEDSLAGAEEGQEEE